MVRQSTDLVEELSVGMAGAVPPSQAGPVVEKPWALQKEHVEKDAVSWGRREL